MNSNINTETVVQALRAGILKPERYGEYWTEEDRERMNTLFDAGVGITAIALEMQRSESSVVQQLIVEEKFANSRPSRVRNKAPHTCKCAHCTPCCDEAPDYCPKKPPL